MRRKGSCDFLKFMAFSFSFNTMQFSFPSVSFPVHAYFYGQVFHLVMLPLKKKVGGAIKIFKSTLTVLSDSVLWR